MAWLRKMGLRSMNADDFLTTELKTHSEEFKAARETMLFHVGASRQVINITYSCWHLLRRNAIHNPI